MDFLFWCHDTNKYTMNIDPNCLTNMFFITYLHYIIYFMIFLFIKYVIEKVTKNSTTCFESPKRYFIKKLF